MPHSDQNPIKKGGGMSIFNPRCLVCGAPFGDKWTAHESDNVRDTEVCSDECYDLYIFNEDEATEEEIEQFNSRLCNI